MKARRDLRPNGIQETLNLVTGRLPQTVFLEGPEGTGKTTALSAFEGWLKERSYPVARLQCRQQSYGDYGTAARALSSLRRLHPQRAAQLDEQYADFLLRFRHRVDVCEADLRRLKATVVRLDTPFGHAFWENTVGLIRTQISYLLRLVEAADRPTALLVDDLQWADGWSVSFFVHLARRIKRSSLVVCLACDSTARVKSKVLRDFSRSVDCLRLFTAQDADNGGIRLTREFPSDRSIKRFDQRRTALWRKERDLLAAERQPSSQRNPASMDELIQGRLEGLRETERTVLEALAVWGEPLDRQRLAATLRCEALPLPLAETLSSLAQRCIVVERQGRWRFSHPVWERVVLKTLPRVRRHRWHGNAAAVLEAELRQSPQWSVERVVRINRLYFHALKSGDWLKTMRLDSAYYSSALNTETNHLRENLQEMWPLVTTETDLGKAIKRKLAYRLRDVCRKQRRIHRAISACRAFLRLETEPAERAQAFADLSVIHSMKATPAGYEKALELADAGYREAYKIKDPALCKDTVAHMNNSKALTHYRLGQLDTVLDLENNALELLEEAALLSDDKLGWLRETIFHNLYTVYRRLVKDIPTACRYLQKRLDLAGDRAPVAARTETLRILGDSLFEAGQIDEALRIYQESADLTRGNMLLPLTFMLCSKAAGVCRHRLGDYAGAARNFENALSVAVDMGKPDEIAGLMSNLGLSYHHQAKFEEAFSCYVQALRLKMLEGRNESLGQTYVDLGLVSVKLNDFRRAARLFEKAAAIYAGLNRLEKASQCERAAASFRIRAQMRMTVTRPMMHPQEAVTVAS